jgi:photosystem II stability/assembly factor-like uncharacterized protein
VILARQSDTHTPHPIPDTMKYTLFLPVIILSLALQAQQVKILHTGTSVSLRGLSVVDNNTLWVSGSNGTVGQSLDGGLRWKWITVPGFEKRDFRDIEAFDKNTAIIMAIAEPAVILKTLDGGKTWKNVYENKTAGMFLDAMGFFDNNNGIVLGDPINGKFFIARTSDQGKTWQDISSAYKASADSGEVCFASSGTNIRKLYKQTFCFISGGRRSRYFAGGSVQLPIIQGKASTGANSIAVWNKTGSKTNQYLVVVGGDFAAATGSLNNCFLSKDGGHHWVAPAISPHGYRSCVEFICQKQLISCGTSGVDFSTDAGEHWKLLSTESFHVCSKAKNGTAVFLAGGNGKIGVMINY